MVHLQEIYSKHRNDGLVVVGVNTTDKRTFVKRFVARFGLTIPMLHDTSPEADSTLGRYSTVGITHPLTYVLDDQGRVLHAWAGYDKAKTDSVLHELIDSGENE